jgi:hypothetical protein
VSGAPGRGEAGQATVELLGLLFLVLVALLVVTQLFLVGVASVAADNAARTAARAASLGRDGAAAAAGSVPAGLRSRVAVQGGRALVQVDVPLLLPGPPRRLTTLTRSAEMPPTRS